MAGEIQAAMAIAGGLAGASSSIKGGKQALINAQLRAQQIERNALIAKRNEERERILSSSQRAESRIRGREFLGAQLVQSIQSGVEMTGTPMRNAVQTANQIELEINKQSWMNEENALALRMQYDGFISQARLERYGGQAQYDASKRAALGSLLSGGAQAYSYIK